MKKKKKNKCLGCMFQMRVQSTEDACSRCEYIVLRMSVPEVSTC